MGMIYSRKKSECIRGRLKFAAILFIDFDFDHSHLYIPIKQLWCFQYLLLLCFQANPASMDFCEDLCSLRHLNESSVLHTLRQRYGNHLVYTRAGPALIAINPAAPLPIYSDKVIIIHSNHD